MDLITAIAVALAFGLFLVAGKLLEKGVLEPALEPANELLKQWLQRGYRQAETDAKLLKAVQKALESAGAPPARPWTTRIGCFAGCSREAWIA